MLITKGPKGTKDILPKESYKWQYIEKVMREVCELFNFEEIRVPTFEHTELFLRSVGDTSDIVNKEMYTFLDKGNRSITLKPEGTAGVARALLQNNLDQMPMPIKMYYLNSSIFRYERPQAGRLREHHQFGAEIFGSPSPRADIEVIMLAMTLLNKLGINSLSLNINSIGCPTCRPAYNAKLKEYLKENYNNMCDTCKERYETNPMRILDCKSDGCKILVKDAPKSIDNLCDECGEHFEQLKSYLNSLGTNYIVNPLIVRGLDYYTKTVFELTTDTIGAQGTVCGGGRYDNLISEIGGNSMPGIGFGLGMERLLLTMESAGIEIPIPEKIDVYLAIENDSNNNSAINISHDLRELGFSVEIDLMDRSLKSQMKYADKINCNYVIIVGAETSIIRSMSDGTQQEINNTDISKRIGR